MRKRSVSILLLVVALLLSAWGNVIAAAFCPRYAFNLECCLKHSAARAKKVEHKSSCQHEMTDMEMDDMRMDNMQMERKDPSESAADSIVENSPIEFTAENSSDQLAFDLPMEACAHCWSHSQPTSGAVASVAVDPSKRLVETDAPPANLAVALPSGFPATITPPEHGPPGNSFRRHVLISVFRI
jgi:hypothetical protein